MRAAREACTIEAMSPTTTVAEPSSSSPPATSRSPLAATGIVGAALSIVSAFAAGSLPSADASTDTITAFWTAHRGALLIGAAVSGLSAAAFVVFVSYLARWLTTAAPDHGHWATATHVSWVLLFAAFGLTGFPAVAIVWRGAAAVDPSLVRLAFDLQTLGAYALTACFAAMSVIAPTIVLVRARVAPTWLLVLAAVEVAVNVVELVCIGARTGAATAGSLLGVGPLVWAVWVAGLSGWLARR